MSTLKDNLMKGVSYPENISYLGDKPNFTRDTFDNLDDMQEALDLGYIDEGHLSYCKEDGKHYKASLKEGSLVWKVFKPGGSSEGSLGVYTPAMYDALDEEDKPSDYIEVDENSNTEIASTDSATLGMLMSAIRSLQAEVLRLKNSFGFGINSCVGTETAATRILHDLDEDGVEEEEPLWAVQESELSSIFSLQFNTETELKASNGGSVTLGPDNDYFTVTGEATWMSTDCGSNSFNMKDLSDAKMFLYITTTGKDVELEFKNESDSTYSINLDDIIDSNVTSETYANLLCISKKTTDATSGEKYGKNFVWFVSEDIINSNTLVETYLDPSTGEKYENPTYLTESYYLNKVTLRDLKLSKFDVYTKYQDFSDEITGVAPSDIEDIKYKAAHITIRSVETLDILDKNIKIFQDNELVYVISTSSLYIIYDRQKHKIGAGTDTTTPTTTDTMTVNELITNLSSQGIITLEDAQYNEDGELTSVGNIELNKIASMSFINESTEEEITYTVNSDGELIGYKETPDNLKFSYIVEDENKTNTVVGSISDTLSNLSLAKKDAADAAALTTGRGFIARLWGDSNSSSASDTKLKSDRVKIGAFYIPKSDLTQYGCSHAYVELENTSTTDYYLDGCYLHFAGPIIGTSTDGTSTTVTQATYHLALSGKLPAGGTYLVKGCEYVSEDLPTTYIKVGKPDKEWYITSSTVDFTPASGYTYSDNYKKLIDFSYNTSGENIVYGFALTYGRPNLLYSTTLVGIADSGNENTVRPYLIDSIALFNAGGNKWISPNKKGKVALIETKGNYIYKNTFELDPAKQAYQSYNTLDSSRLRCASSSDYQLVDLNQEYIQLPNSQDTCPVSVFTPKASFDDKNVMTDKTQIDSDKPNMVTVSFGIDQTKTRCFNWISVGSYSEYIWIRPQGSTNWTRFESYWGDSCESTNSEYSSSITISRREFNDILTYDTDKTTTIKDIVYASPKYKNIFPGNKVSYTSHKCILDITDSYLYSPRTYEYIVGRSESDGTPMEGHISDTQTFTIYPNTYRPVIYQVTDQQGFHWLEYQAWEAAAKVINDKINSDISSNTTYTITTDTKILEGKTYYTKSDGSEKSTAAVNSTISGTLYEKIGIIPILLNTGDMTQNGTRINEWLDYYNAGYCLFDHLEQMNVVGNNDLGNYDETILGTGDDPGKSNPHFYNISYCYEIPFVKTSTDVYCPIFTGSLGPVYIPSIYYFDVKDFRIFMGNSEITATACKNIFVGNLTDVYTGYLSYVKDQNNLSDSELTYKTASSTSLSIDSKSYNANHYVYDILYQWLKADSSKKAIFACHEMPFTVVTLDNLGTAYKYSDRSISVVGDSTGLIGSHCNRNYFVKTNTDFLGKEFKVRSKGTYWLSRLLENCGIKYCIGGHKHTYACTWPVREYYYYPNPSGGYYSSLTNGPMTMPSSLKDDDVYFLMNYDGSTIGDPVIMNEAISGSKTQENINTLGDDYATKYINLTKYPIAASGNFDGDSIKGSYSGSGSYINSITKDTYTGTNKTYVLYFMLQASGFKLKSNKELPGTLQKFSQIIPKTSGTTPGLSQIYPMFAKIDLNKSNYDTGLDINLMAITNIVPNSTSEVLNQQSAFDSCTETPEIKYFDNDAEDSSKIPYGDTTNCWSDEEKVLNLHI